MKSRTQLSDFHLNQVYFSWKNTVRNESNLLLSFLSSTVLCHVNIQFPQKYMSLCNKQTHIHQSMLWRCSSKAALSTVSAIFINPHGTLFLHWKTHFLALHLASPPEDVSWFPIPGIQVTVKPYHMTKCNHCWPHNSFPGASDGKESACLQCGRPGFDPWVRKIPGEGNGNPFQYSCLENPKDRAAWRATVHGVMKESDTTEQLSLGLFTS